MPSAGNDSGGFGGFTPGVCGDSNWGYGEQCDDGNASSGDGCDSACQQEVGWVCGELGSPCHRPVCGDGIQDGWFIPGAGPVEGSGGGNGGTYYWEQCDDGNANPGDGCSSTCTIEPGWVCSAPGEACHEPVCGDGIIDFIVGAGGGAGGGGSGGASGSGSGGFAGGSYGAFEACDDGNTAPGDGCDPVCSVEPGWYCNNWGSPCHRTVCGDGFIDYPSEDCDDGNQQAGDGCSPACTWENVGGGGFGGGFSGGVGGVGGLGGAPGGTGGGR